MINPKQISERIRAARKQKNYTVEQLAEKLNMSASAYNRLENGLTSITLERLAEIANYLSLPEKELFDTAEIEEESLLTRKYFDEKMQKMAAKLYIMLKEVITIKNRVNGQEKK